MRKHLLPTMLAACLGLAGSAMAADLPSFLPADTIFAVGVEGIAEHEAKAQPFVDEWNRLGLTELLEAAFPAEAEDELAEEMPDISFEAGLLDVLGREAWLTVSASQFNPLPAVTVMALVTPEGSVAVQELLGELEAEGEVSQMTEGDVTFSVLAPNDAEGLPTPIAYATFEDVVLVSSNPDVARGVLRRYQGADEPSLATNSGYQGTIGAQRAGNSYMYVDLAAAVDVAAPFAAGMGFDALVERVGAAAGTGGVYGTITTVTDDGIQTQSTRVLGSQEGDPLLYEVLTAGGPVSDGVLAFMPPAAPGVSVGSVDIAGWWAWLEDVVASEPQIGITDLDQIVTDMVGLDLQRTLFGWMGDEVGTITLGFGEASAMPTDLTNPLGEVVYLVEATDEAAAASGLNELFTVATGFASSFMDPMGEGAMVEPAQRDVGGVSVTDWQLAEGFSISVAVADGYALIATTPEAMDAVLGASGGGAGMSAALTPLYERVPDGVRSFTLSDDRAALASTAEALVDQFGMMSGMMGGDIDFEAVEAASAALSEFLLFATERFGGSYSYATIEGQTIRGEGHSFVDW